MENSFELLYCKIIDISCDNFSRQIIFGQTTLYCIIDKLIVRTYFRMFNFHTSQAVQNILTTKYSQFTVSV